jgi:superfamily II RNA helicase
MSTQTATGDINQGYTIGSSTGAGQLQVNGSWNVPYPWGTLTAPNNTQTWLTDNTMISPSSSIQANIYPFSEMLEKLKRLEERMGMIERNLLLETRYKELKELGERYKELEKDLLEKEKIVEILKR